MAKPAPSGAAAAPPPKRSEVPLQKKEAELHLKHKEGGNRPAFERKLEALDDLAQRGKLSKSESLRDRKVTEQYRRNLVKQAEKQWGKTEPERVRKIEKLVQDMDADHLHELQLGGVDQMSHLTMLDKGVNRSVGAQIGHQLKKLPDGTKITRVLEKGTQ